MNTREFQEKLDALRATNSRNEKEDIIEDMSDSPAAISFLSGAEFDDAGLGKKTVLSCAQEAYGDDIDGKPTVSESLDHATTSNNRDDCRSLGQVRSDMRHLARESGNDMKEMLTDLLEGYTHPAVLSHACLNDWPTGVGDSTIADAMGVRDSLPFYDGVHKIAEEDEPVTKPEVGHAFKPQLAKSESSLPDSLDGWWGQPKLDGYRAIIHVYNQPQGDKGYAKAYSRRMNDITESLPELGEIDWPAGKYILDCEVIASDGTYKSTSERIGRKSENVEREVEMEFGFFDIIMSAGEEVHDLPYRKRYDKLDSALISVDDERVGILPVYKNEEKARKEGRIHEGVIWKNPDARYSFDKRSKAWVKEKNTAETVDVVAVAFEEGEGRLDGTLGKVVLESEDGVELGRTGSGFSDEQRDEVWSNQEEYLGQPLEVEAEAFDSGLRFPIFQRWRIDDGCPDSSDRIREILPAP